MLNQDGAKSSTSSFEGNVVWLEVIISSRSSSSNPSSWKFWIWRIDDRDEMVSSDQASFPPIWKQKLHLAPLLPLICRWRYAEASGEISFILYICFWLVFFLLFITVFWISFFFFLCLCVWKFTNYKVWKCTCIPISFCFGGFDWHAKSGFYRQECWNNYDIFDFYNANFSVIWGRIAVISLLLSLFSSFCVFFFFLFQVLNFNPSYHGCVICLSLSHMMRLLLGFIIEHWLKGPSYIYDGKYLLFSPLLYLLGFLYIK